MIELLIHKLQTIQSPTFSTIIVNLDIMNRQVVLNTLALNKEFTATKHPKRIPTSRHLVKWCTTVSWSRLSKITIILIKTMIYNLKTSKIIINSLYLLITVHKEIIKTLFNIKNSTLQVKTLLVLIVYFTILNKTIITPANK